GRVPRDVFRKMGELGFFGIDYPEDVGGLGLDYGYVVVFAEELTRARSGGLNTSILVHAQMATPVLQQVGSEHVRKTFLPGMISGEKIFGLGVTEPGAGSDVAAIRTTARRDGDEYVIDGAKTWITNGGIADYITLLVKTDPAAGHRGMSLVVFPTDTKGFTVGRVLNKLGNHASNTAELSFDGCRIPRANLVGEEGKGFYYVMKNFQGERLIASVNAVAAAERAWEDARRYLEERHAFGAPLARLQVWRHELVDLLTQIEAGRRLCYHAAELHDRRAEATKEISMAKAFCGEMAIRVVDRCLQAYGGYGYSEEYPLARQYRDIRLCTIGGGTTEIMREIIAKAIGLP
ncbi:MAG TPA: acyl-CoA dehydrogenase family protein, partial [Planctomycetota bacterium]|nr:acyl-CoA dehydrogenase family protein [Planctomycetota bacterium]